VTDCHWVSGSSPEHGCDRVWDCLSFFQEGRLQLWIGFSWSFGGISGWDINDGNTEATLEALDSGITCFVAHGLCDTDYHQSFNLQPGSELGTAADGLPWRCAEPLSAILSTQTLSLIGKPWVQRRKSEECLRPENS
jgi:hypothetical protein